MDRVVALKVLHPYWTQDPNFAARFRQEARAAANLRHANIVTVYEAGEVEGQLYIAMEYLPGRTLHDLLEAEGALSLEGALPILEQIAAALDHAHGQGVIHRDIKPLNVMVEDTTSGPQVTLMDFGLVKAMEGSSALTSQGTLLGSPEYMAPEQADFERAAEIGPATDRYALGIVAYRMLVGRVPFPGNTPVTLHAHLFNPPPDPRMLLKDLHPGSDLPSEVADVLLTMLAKAPDDRFPTAAAFVARLRKTQDAERQRQAREQQGARLTPLRAQLQAAVDQRDWPEVLHIGRQIQVLQPDDPTAAQWIAHALKNIRPPVQMLVWLRSVGIILAVGIVLGVLIAITPLLWDIFFATSTPVFSLLPCETVGVTWIRPTDGMTLVCVPGGSFLMGSGAGENDEKPVHRVTLSTFWIDKTEITNAQYAKCVADGACTVPAYVDDTRLNGDQQPVVGVDWYDAAAYCSWSGAQLPTEAQWEYAARGGERYIYPWGNDWREKVANCMESVCQDGYEFTAPVGSFPEGKSWVGALDMAGNVWEWTADWYSAYSSEAQTNPTTSANGYYRVMRGGSWPESEFVVRSSHRHWLAPTFAYYDLGFRCMVLAQD
ncbi:MAG: bifunctional serine/threonine-protein kinase/formylglycine-generating enzyme family protein [Anaerolineae bacterium]